MPDTSVPVAPVRADDSKKKDDKKKDDLKDGNSSGNASKDKKEGEGEELVSSARTQLMLVTDMDGDSSRKKTCNSKMS